MWRVIAVLLVFAASAIPQSVFPKRVSPVSAQEVGSFQKQTKVALLVGISKYPAGSGFSALNYAAADVTEIGALLTQQGYTVALLTDGEASRAAIRKSLRQIAASVDASQSTILFYFSGHGYAVKDKYYLAPVSASDDDLESEGLAVSEVEQALAASQAQRKLMMLDACRNAAGEKKGAGGRSISALEAASGFRILNSTKVGDYSYESPEFHHGVFSNFVLQGLRGEAKNSDGLVTYYDLAAYVNESMRKWSIVNHKDQIPYEALGGEANGDFLLARLNAGGMAATVIPAAAAPAASSESRPPYNWPAAIHICAAVAGKNGCATWLWQGTQYLARNDDGTSAHITFDGPQGNGLIQVTQKGPNGVTGKYIGSFNADGKGNGSTEFRWLLNKVGGTWTATPLTGK